VSDKYILFNVQKIKHTYMKLNAAYIAV